MAGLWVGEVPLGARPVFDLHFPAGAVEVDPPRADSVHSLPRRAWQAWLRMTALGRGAARRLSVFLQCLPGIAVGVMFYFLACLVASNP